MPLVATTTAESPTLSDERLADLLKLAAGADSVELKLTVPETALFTTARALGMDPLDAQIRQVFFFDTPDLALYRHGVVPRARRIQQKAGDSVIKLRPVVPAELPKATRKSPAFGVEVDAMPGGFVCSGSLKGALGTTEVREAAVLGTRRISALFSKEQRAFYARHAPAGLELDDLAVLGPIFVLKLKFALAGYPRRLVAEMWLYPDGSRVLELSTKCAPAEAFQAAAETRAILTQRGIDLFGVQQTKTRLALDFFAARLKESADPAAAAGQAAAAGEPAPARPTASAKRAK
jgi:hypothetical protein